MYVKFRVDSCVYVGYNYFIDKPLSCANNLRATKYSISIMLNYELQIDQGNRIPEAPNHLRKSAHRSKPPTEKYSEGWFNGLIGENPMYPENSDYWSGYSLGNREFWCSKKGVELSDRF